MTGKYFLLSKINFIFVLILFITFGLSCDNQDLKKRPESQYIETNSEPMPCSCYLTENFKLDLRAITLKKAKEMSKYIRKTRVERIPNSGQDMPISWSKINSDCEKRMVAVQHVLASTGNPEQPAKILCPDDFEKVKLQYLSENSAIDVKGIEVISQELGTKQQLLNYDGTPASERTLEVGWSSHYIALINVEGTCKVLDLSVSDEPLDIKKWISGFYAGECPYDDSNNCGCSYQVLPIFNASILDEPTKIPGELEDASYDFLKNLTLEFDIQNPSKEDLPFYLTHYTALNSKNEE